MALYLGNQKVSLRSGQDPTFDYGFDSNGRLVFANKNATEINNFLNYDSSYSEILDLSNLSKMEKVAVNGTADRKMEGLKGLLVSPNAPFTGSSPQINASYTGLNKSALVSLFESAPYNVGYTKVGNPTIVDGVVTFPDTGANFLRLPRMNFDTVDFEFVFKATPGKFPPDGGSILYSFGSGPIAYILFINSRLAYSAAQGYTSPQLDFQHQSFVTGQYYYIKFKKKNEVMSLGWSNDNLTYTEQTYQIQTGDDFRLSSNIQIGYNGYQQSYDFYGSIDLNETYIKVNGVPWFNGAATRQLDPAATNVGGVTITNGVASGFSGSKYIRVPNFSTASPLEMVIRTKYNTFTSGVRYLFGFSGFYILQDSVDSIYCSIQKSDETLVYPNFGPGLLPDTFYYLKFVYDGTTLWAGRSTDGTNYTEMYNQPLSLYSRTGTAILGYRNSATTVWDGSIDLNNTYIKSGGTYIYRGMVPMTKTCSIVGATGTADLTQEDKNIILNKGWSLTVQ